MRIRTAFAAAALALAAASTALAVELIMRPGRWEVTAQMYFGGRQLPPGMSLAKPMTSVTCITPEEVKQAQSPIPLPDKSCKVSDYQADGQEITFTVRCEEATMKYQLTVHSPDSYSGASISHGEDPSQEMTIKFAGKRTGDACSAQELAGDAKDDG